MAMPDPKRRELLQSEMGRVHRRKSGQPLACIWTRSDGYKNGLHSHLFTHWAPPIDDLIRLLVRLTGCPATSEKLSRGVEAQSKCKGWQIKRGIGLEIPTAMDFANYALKQDHRLVAGSMIEGKLLGVSRAIRAKAIAPHRQELEAWKRDVGWGGIKWAI